MCRILSRPVDTMNITCFFGLMSVVMRLSHIACPLYYRRRIVRALAAGLSVQSSKMFFEDILATPHPHGMGTFSGLGSLMVNPARSLTIALAVRLGILLVNSKRFILGVVWTLQSAIHLSVQ